MQANLIPSAPASCHLIMVVQFPLSPMGMGWNGRTDLPRGSTKRSPLLSWTVFSLGCPLTGHNSAAPFLIDRTPFQCLLIPALLLVSGKVHPNPGPICKNPRPRYLCSICHGDVDRDSLQCTFCLKWVHFRCSSLTRAGFCTICATGTAVGWHCPACCPQSQTGPLLRPILLLQRLHPLHPLPQVSPRYHLDFINRVPLRAPQVTTGPCALMR